MPQLNQVNALAGLEAFNAGREQRTNRQVSNALAGNDLNAARQAAFQGGQVNTGLALQQYQDQVRQRTQAMNERERERLRQNVVDTDRFLVELGSLDQAQAIAAFDNVAPLMVQRGIMDQGQVAQYRALIEDPNYQANIRGLRGIIAEDLPEFMQPRPTSDMRNFDRASENPDFAAFLDRRRTPPATVNVSTGTQSTPDQIAREGLAGATGERYANFIDQGMAASRSLLQINRLDELLSNSPQGAEGAFIAFAGDLGLDFDGTSDVQAARALINSLVPAQRPAGSGPMSDADLELFKQSLPRIINQPGGNALIMGTIRGIANYDVQLGQIAQAFEADEINGAEARRRINQLQNPIDLFRERADTTGAGPAPVNRLVYNPETGLLEMRQ